MTNGTILHKRNTKRQFLKRVNLGLAECP